jgi:hypothetical protein
MRYPDGGWSVQVPARRAAERDEARIAAFRRSLANLAKRNLAQLTALVKTRLRRMQYRPGLLEGFLASTRLDLAPFCNPGIKHR